jgi:hypothetical protein
VEIAHWWVASAGIRRRVWLLGYGNRTDYKLVRQLRIDLVRLHCEREVLRLILTMIADKALLPTPRSAESEALQQYLNGAINRVIKLDKVREHLLASLVQGVQDERARDEVAALHTSLEAQLRSLDIRPNLRRKTVSFADSSELRFDAPQLDRLALETLIIKQLSLNEYRRLCLATGDLMKRDGIDELLTADIIGGDGLPERALELTAHLERRGRLDYLRRALEELWPDLL